MLKRYDRNPFYYQRLPSHLSPMLPTEGTYLSSLFTRM